MKLNKYQKAGIKALKTRKTKKHMGRMGQSEKGRAMCCLGVFCKIVCKDDDYDYRFANLNACDLTMGQMDLHSPDGFIRLGKVSDKWKKKLAKRLDLDYPITITYLSLVELNDGLSDGSDLSEESSFSHPEIGQFMEDNPEAVFHKPSS